MDATILLLWIVILLILHILVEKSLQMKKIAEAFMNVNNNMRTRQSLTQDVNNLPEQGQEDQSESDADRMESDLLNFLMNGDPALTKQMGEPEADIKQPAVGEFNLVNHTNILNDKVSPKDERYQLNSGKFANLNTFDSIVSDNGMEQFSAPMN